MIYSSFSDTAWVDYRAEFVIPSEVHLEASYDGNIELEAGRSSILLSTEISKNIYLIARLNKEIYLDTELSTEIKLKAVL